MSPPDSDPGAPRTRAGDTGQQQNWTPRPDPTDLTTKALYREVENLQALIDMRMRGMDELVDEKFASIDKQFALIERQRVEQKIDGERAIAAALSAAEAAVKEQTIASEKSIAKSEAATTKAIDSLEAVVDRAFDQNRRDIDDLKTRVTAFEAAKAGGQEVKTESREVVREGQAINAQTIAVASVVLTLALAVIGYGAFT